jgi:hypothetical protein
VLVAPAGPLRLATQLLADKGEPDAELFVLDDRGLRDLANFVEGPIRQFNVAVNGSPLAAERLMSVLP